MKYPVYCCAGGVNPKWSLAVRRGNHYAASGPPLRRNSNLFKRLESDCTGGRMLMVEAYGNKTFWCYPEPPPAAPKSP